MDNLNQSGERVVQIDDANPISLLKNPEKFKDTFYQMTSIASQSLKVQQYQRALKALTKSLDMLDVLLGKNILKDASKYWKLCIYGNLACAYQGTWKMQKCNKFSEKIEEQLQKLLETADCKQNYLNITKHLIRIKFQHCAILSQLSQHQRALAMCQSTLPTLKNYITTILEYTESLKSNRSDKKSSETVHFSKHVCAFAEQILTNLVNCLNDPLKLNFDKSSFYYWQKNPENNEKQVQKKFVSPRSNDSCKRSILGVNKIVHWIDQFNIGTIMHMSQLSVSDFEQTLPIQQYLFKDKLYETVIHCSIAHFTIATEMRFIESNRQRQKSTIDQSQASSPILSNIQSINKKYGYQQKSEMFRLSQLYHLRAINIMALNIKTTVPYISHLIKSYDKHYIYKKQLDPVMAIAQESLMSISDANQMSISKKQFNYNGNKGNSRMNSQDNEQEHYFTNMNPNIQQNHHNNNIANSGNSGFQREYTNIERIQTENIQILDELEDDVHLNGAKSHDKFKRFNNKEKKQKNSTIKPEMKKEDGMDDDVEDSDEQIVNMVPNYTNDINRAHSVKKIDRNKSGIKNRQKREGGAITQRSLKKQDPIKGIKKKQVKEKDKDKEKDKKKKGSETERQFRVKHQSTTQIKVIAKKKK